MFSAWSTDFHIFALIRGRVFIGGRGGWLHETDGNDN